jgi:hypothetical protein
MIGQNGPFLQRVSLFSGDLTPYSGEFLFFPATLPLIPASFSFFRRPYPLFQRLWSYSSDIQIFQQP